ncbi:MAG: hypothetical protein ABJA57_04615 [Ginsengibacter sp.]
MRNLILLLILIVCYVHTIAQDTLPNFTVNHITSNVLVSWTNPFTSLTTINIQRSYDSTKNFKTIGTVLDVKNKKNGFVDPKPPTFTMFYRIFLSFEGGTYLFCSSSRPVLDTSKVLPVFKNLQQSTVATWFVPSKRVYSNTENNVIINLPEAATKKCVVKFFDENGTPLFEVNKITDTYLTIEKVNFLRAGTYNFEVYEDGLMIEKHKFYISKEGKPVQIFNDQEKNAPK